jgi:hypothetical protein
VNSSDQLQQKPALTDPQTSEQLGCRLGRYSITGELGSGGSSAVLQVFDPQLGRLVAAKVLLHPDDRVARDAFEHEARILALLQHPNILPVHELGTDDSGRPYFTMRRIEGETLHERLQRLIRQRGISNALPALLAIVERVGAALAYAHSRDVLHLDVKPANVMIGAQDQIQLVDWGLARQIQSPAPLAHSDKPHDDELPLENGVAPIERVRGTPAYMAPEQALGRPLDPRTDVYALGALLYHVVCCVPPYLGESGNEVITNLLAGPPLPPRQRSPLEVPWELEAIILRAMARQRSKRYPTINALLDDLARYRRGATVLAARYGIAGWTHHALQDALRIRRSTMVALTALLVLLTWLGVLSQPRQGNDPELVQAREVIAATTQQRQRVENELSLARASLGRLMQGQARRAIAHGELLEATLFAAAAAAQGGPDFAMDIPCPVLMLDDMFRVALDRISALALAGDGQQLAAASGSHVMLWHRHSQGRLQTLVLTGHVLPVIDIAFSLDGSRLYSIDEAMLLAWDTTTGRLLFEIPLESPPQRIEVGTSQLVLLVGYGRMQLLDLAASEFLQVFDREVHSAAFSSGGELLVLCMHDHAIELWDPLARVMLGQHAPLALNEPVAQHSPLAVCVSEPGFVAHTLANNMIVLRSLADGAILARLDCGKTVATLALDGNRHLLACLVDGTLVLWSLADYRLLQRLSSRNDAARHLALASGGYWALTSAASTTDTIGGTKPATHALWLWRMIPGCRPSRFTPTQAERISGATLTELESKPLDCEAYHRLRELVQYLGDTTTQ